MGERLIVKLEDGTYDVPVDALEQYRVDDEDEVVGFAFGATSAQIPSADNWAPSTGTAVDGSTRIGQIAIVGQNG